MTQGDDAAWPIRGPLAADRIFMAEMTRKIAQTKSPDAPAMLILYAGDINDKRLVLAGGIEDLGFGRSARRVETYIGPRGASAQTMVGESSDMHTQLDPAEPLVYVPDWNAPRWVLILAPPRRTQFGVSDNPHYALDGTPSRTFRPVDVSHGFAVVPITSRLASNLVLEYRSNTIGTAAMAIRAQANVYGHDALAGQPELPPPPANALIGVSGDCNRDSSTVRISVHQTVLPEVTEWFGSDDLPVSVVFAVIRRGDGTAYRSIEVRHRHQNESTAPVVCAPVPAATADLLPYVAPVNNETAFVVVLPRPHPEVATAEIRASAAPNAPVVVHAKVVGQRAFLPLITPGPPVKGGDRGPEHRRRRAA